MDRIGPAGCVSRPGFVGRLVSVDHRVAFAERLAAIAALVLTLAALVLAASFVVDRFPRGLIVFFLVAIALAAAWYGLVGDGAVRVIGFSLAGLILAATVLLLAVDGGDLVKLLVVMAALALASAAARRAFKVSAPLAGAPAPDRPVLFFNPKSGGGKAERFSLEAEARARGIEAVKLELGTDLEELVRGAVAGGADGLAMAGGDGSQAIVAAIAAELDLPYACIPAGTRNHFALDLGVDRDDVVGALDAFMDGGERRVDLAEVNGRVFVNNVSLGLYAEAVQRDSYRDAKLRTLLETVPEMVRPDGDGVDLRWTDPGGREHCSGAEILVSNNLYRLGRAVGAGTRPRIDDGLLGVTVVSDPAESGRRISRLQTPWSGWSASAFEIGADETIPVGIDGESATLEPPLRFRIRPGVLRVRIARAHPGASPSAAIPEGVLEGVRALARISLGRPPNAVGSAETHRMAH